MTTDGNGAENHPRPGTIEHQRGVTGALIDCFGQLVRDLDGRAVAVLMCSGCMHPATVHNWGVCEWCKQKPRVCVGQTAAETY